MQRILCTSVISDWSLGQAPRSQGGRCGISKPFMSYSYANRSWQAYLVAAAIWLSLAIQFPSFSDVALLQGIIGNPTALFKSGTEGAIDVGGSGSSTKGGRASMANVRGPLTARTRSSLMPHSHTHIFDTAFEAVKAFNEA